MGLLFASRKGHSMKGTLIVLEGIDGSGKATQSALLAETLQKEGKDLRRVAFPDYESDSSALVRMYLAGEFGSDPSDVNPFAASLFFALDRFASYRTKWRTFYASGGLVIADRYTTSNMVHQMTKYDDPEERLAFLQWLEETEYEKLELPRPEHVVLLDMPLALSERLVRQRAAEGGSMDIHEQHLDYLRRCHEAYRLLAERYGWLRVPCAEGDVLLSPARIAEAVRSRLREAGLA